MSGMKIGEAAAKAGLTTRTLRYYEEMGLFSPGARNEGGFRLYGDEELRRLERIGELKNLLGFNLLEIKEILTVEDELAELRREYKSAPEDEARKRGILERALELNSRLRQLVEGKVAALVAMKDHLDERARTYRKALRKLGSGVGASGD